MKTDPNFPNGPLKSIHGKCLVLQGDDIDTDRIIPARFLKCVDFESLGHVVFADDRKEQKGNHPFDLEKNQDASILIVNKNFGCGSSREHAPQALMRWGIRAIVGESFAEIFFGNCLALGIPCATASNSDILKLQKELELEPRNKYLLDVNNSVLRCNNKNIHMNINKGALEMLLSGKWDATATLISKTEELKKIMKDLPYLNNFLLDK